MVESRKFVSKYDRPNAFNELSRLPRITCTIPGTSVEFERSFSCLRLVGKMHLRTTILDERISLLSSLAMLSMHSERVTEFDWDSH